MHKNQIKYKLLMRSLPSIRTLEIEPKSASNFSCVSCQLSFATSQDLIIHQGKPSSHPLGDLNPSENPIKPQNTEQIHSTRPKIKCKFCHKKFDDKYTMKHHRKQEHQSNSEVECPLCGKVLISRISYKKHFIACKINFCKESVSLCRK